MGWPMILSPQTMYIIEEAWNDFYVTMGRSGE